jgi:DNA polymerase-3 subunit gamma/tau
VAARLAGSGRDPGQLIRDLEIHGRELLAVQVLEEVPEELRVTSERDARLLAQAQAIPGPDVVRLLELVSAALEATSNGAQARIQLELVLIKAAAPEVDPSTKALLSRIERLEDALRLGGGPAPAVARPAAAVAAAPAAAQPADAAPAAAPPVPDSQTAPVAAIPDPGPPAPPAPDPTPPPPPPAPDPTPPPAPDPPLPPAPEPEPPLPPTPPLPDPGLSAPEVDTVELDTLVQSWPAVVDYVRQGNAMLAATLEAASPAALNGAALTVAFPTGAAFFKRKAEQDDNRKVTADAVKSVTGARLALRYELRDEGPVAPEADTNLTGEELVRRFMEEFDAEEVLDDTDQEEASH